MNSRYFLTTRHIRVFTLAATIAAAQPALGAPVEFELDPALSTLQLAPAVFQDVLVTSGTKLTHTVGIIEQEPQSLVANLSGSLVGDLTGGILTLNSQSVVIAQANSAGPFLPSPQETGSSGIVDIYGAQAVSNGEKGFDREAYIAVRDVEARLLGGALTIGGSAKSITVEVTQGIIDVLERGDTSGYYEELTSLLDPAGNTSSQPVTGSFDGTIHIPFTLDYIFDFLSTGDGRISLRGTLVGKRKGSAPIPGDFDGNGIVDAADLAQWKGDYGLNGNSDSDGDGDTDGADFLTWQRQLGISSPTRPVSTVVPEPGALAMLFAALLAVSHCLRR